MMILVAFIIYLAICYRLYDRYNEFMKIIKFYNLSTETINALEQGRRSLKVQINECLGS